MITLRINEIDYEIKDSWKDFTFAEYCKVIEAKDKNLIERLNAFSNIPYEILNRLTLTQLTYLSGFVQFMDEPEMASIWAKPFTGELNIGKRKYIELEQAKIFLQKKTIPVLACADIIKLYFEKDIWNESLMDVLSQCHYTINAIAEFMAKFKRLNEYEPTIEEFEAGVENLTKFGFFATAVQLARKYGKTHDEILQMPAEEVYTTLLYDFEQSEVERNLIKIQQRKR